MTTIGTIDPQALQSFRARLQAGASLKTLAVEAGVSWQKLWGLVNVPGTPKTATRPSKEAQKPTGPLTERYRPTTLSEVVGQCGAVDVLTKFAQAPYSTSFVFDGETGTGKTSAALALANALGCDLTQKPQEFGGVYTISSGEQTPDAVKDTYRQMFNCPWHGSGWKVVIVNEADRMSGPVETVWLDRLEQLPKNVVVIFTTNHPEKLSARFIDRSTRLTFVSKSDALQSAAFHLAVRIWKAETGKKPDTRQLQEIIAATEQDGQISFRRLVQALTVAIAREVAQ